MTHRFDSDKDLRAIFPLASGKVNGRAFDGPVDNLSSIASSLTSYRVLPGVREVPMSAFDPDYVPGSYDFRERLRVERLAERIRESGHVMPLVVVHDGDPRGLYVLEGGHRFDALLLLGAMALPAIVAVDDGRGDDV